MDHEDAVRRDQEHRERNAIRREEQEMERQGDELEQRLRDADRKAADTAIEEEVEYEREHHGHRPHEDDAES